MPLWIPMRTRIGPPASSAFAAAAAASAAGAVGKAKRTHRPACRPRRRRARRTRRAERAVLGERRRVALLAQGVQELGRALDVGEEEGDRPGRKGALHQRIMQAPRQPRASDHAARRGEKSLAGGQSLITRAVARTYGGRILSGWLRSHPRVNDETALAGVTLGAVQGGSDSDDSWIQESNGLKMGTD